MIQGFTGTPNRHLEVQVSIFIDFREHLGASWDPLWRHVCDFSMVLDAKMGDGSQVHVFPVRAQAQGSLCPGGL